MEISGDVTEAGRTDVRTDDKRTREDRATQPMDCWKAEFRNIKKGESGKNQRVLSDFFASCSTYGHIELLEYLSSPAAPLGGS